MTRGLHTDLYQLTMAVGYLQRGLADTPVVCEAFVRKLPRRRSFLLVAGLGLCLDYLRQLRFTAEQVDYLRGLPGLAKALDDDLCDRLLNFRFTGDLWAMPEGTAAFANEPLLRVEAPLWIAQLVETSLLSTLNHSTLVASKSVRIVEAARGARPGKPASGDGPGIMEFGTRRTHGDAAVHAARAAYIAGCVGTSNVEAGFRHGVPVYGTMAHMWTMVHDSEPAAFDGFLSVYPDGTTLLVDTYGTLEGTRRACAAARRAGRPEALTAVRLDSELFDGAGSPSGICKRTREILDGEGFTHTRIIVSDDMNEDKIASLLDAGEPIDAFGVGTELVTSKDAPTLSGVYKVVWVGGEQGHPVAKLSPGKISWPGAHQVWRTLDGEGKIEGDRLTLADEEGAGQPLLRPFLRGGQLLPAAREHLELEQIRRRAAEQVATLPGGTALDHQPSVVVEPSDRLRALQAETEARLQSQLKK